MLLVLVVGMIWLDLWRYGRCRVFGVCVGMGEVKLLLLLLLLLTVLFLVLGVVV